MNKPEERPEDYVKREPAYQYHLGQVLLNAADYSFRDGYEGYAEFWFRVAELTTKYRD